MTAPIGAAELLVINGADAVTFAHAQFTSDVKSLRVGDWQWSAWLDPQGRVRAFFALIRPEPERLAAWLPLGGAVEMRDALARFVMRAALKMETCVWTLHALDNPAVAAQVSSGRIIALDGGHALRLPGTPERIAWLAPVDAAPIDSERLNDWRMGDIEARLPLLAPMLAGEFLPQTLDLESLDAIRFDKGCYPGQEVAARVHFRGGNKRGLHKVRVHGAAVPAGTPIVGGDGRPGGIVLYGADVAGRISIALAVLPMDQAGALALASGDLVVKCV